MIISPDCDQFICARALGETRLCMSNSMTIMYIAFIPRELFNMAQLQVIYFNPLAKENVSILNLVPTTIRKNLRNINYASMTPHYTKRYTSMVIQYLKGSKYGGAFWN